MVLTTSAETGTNWLSKEKAMGNRITIKGQDDSFSSPAWKA
jgi:hypothetical protein